MRIERVLQDKGNEVITIDPDARVGEAVKLLSERRIGAVIVMEGGGAPAGVLSERDVVRELGRRGPAVLEQTVAEMMTSELTHCAPADTLDQVLTKMTEGRFRHMPVMRDGEMVGLISIGDVVKARLSELAMERDALEGMVMGH